MTVLLLRLAGPLQSWGDQSRFTRRETRPEPTKSGVLGLLAAAQGRRRTEPIEDLARTRFGVRVDQPGALTRDFHTAHDGQGRSMPLSERDYLADAVFLAAVEGEDSLLEGLDEALTAPVFAPYLGRRSCAPAGRVNLGRRPGSVQDALRQEPWQAAVWFRRRAARSVALSIVRDAGNPSEVGDLVRDQPLSFDPLRREHGWRTVVHDDPVHLDNPEGRAPVPSHDPFAALGPS